MKTTLVIPDEVMREVKEKAAREGKTISELVEGSLRRMLEAEKKRPRSSRKPLPILDLGRPLVDVSNREELYRQMEDSD